ncbi:hypothetical protein DPMN_145049 [Dreissena polymorpha]|uniref:Uncharacterized protein n=1 Tax=Dreissena polymorpha TaxID=45954 RepID=A0A9D4F7L5_DREPO|nr:hypothetical protein DPMN_145049 [Dreissena polymorpha]
MDDGRVGACHRLENKRRKFLIVINDLVKSKYEVYADFLDKAEAEADYSFEKSKMFVRRALVRQKVLQKCMKMRRHHPDTKTIFGRYGGKPIEAFSRDIEGFIAHNHPKLRRKRHHQRLLNESLEKGAILKPTVVENRVAGWMERSYTKYKLMKQKRERTNLEAIEEKLEKASKKTNQRTLRLPVLTNPFYSGARTVLESEEDSKPEVDLKPEVGAKDIQTEPDVLNLSDNMENMNLETKQKRGNVLDQKRTLVLPPINPTKVMVSTKN